MLIIGKGKFVSVSVDIVARNCLGRLTLGKRVPIMLVILG